MFAIAFGGCAAWVSPSENDATGAARSADVSIDGTTDAALDASVGSDVSGSVQWPTAIALSRRDPCAVLADGTVWCWGPNSFGRVGVPSILYVTRPVRVGDLANARRVATSYVAAAAALDDGSVVGWGAWVGAPARIAGLEDAVDLAIGYTSGCILQRTGRVVCWGFNRWGSVDPFHPSDEFLAPRDMGLDEIIQVSMSTGLACALRREGVLFCWGVTSGVRREEGIGRVPGIEGALAVDVGEDSVCVIESTRTVRCWGGAGSWPRYCNPLREPCAQPHTIDGLTDVYELALGAQHVCARVGDGTVRCWGSNPSLMIGSTSDAGVLPVTTVRGLSRIVEIGTTSSTSFARDAEGAVFAWGSSFAGQLGTGDGAVDTAEPVRVRW